MISFKQFLLLIPLVFANSLFSQIELIDAFPNLSFNHPLYLTNSGDGTNRVFVVEQSGRIMVFPNSSTTQTSHIYLDLADIVTSGGETGLLGLAFHPDYQTNGFFYVDYIYTVDDTLKTKISRFQVSSNPDSADKNSEFQILTFTQPYASHNGGWIGFGPNDGFLYIATGDGGSNGDEDNNGQRINTLLGKILCVDVDGGTPYAIPPTNAFVDSTNVEVRKEIYAWGFRNPWRCSFDPITGWFIVADVGQGSWEEIDIVQNGKNYGWRCYEGTHQFDFIECNYPEYISPIWEYDHSLGCSITGGYIYRESNIPELEGKYIYGDYCSFKIWALEYDGINPPTNQDLLTAPSYITSFGVDEQKELYLTSENGNIYTFNSILPVELVSFTAGVVENKVELNWQTATEVNNYGFEIERKDPPPNPLQGVEEKDWKKIGFVDGHGNSNSPKSYSFTDTNPFGGRKFNYRLKQVDTDGQYEYSEIVEVEILPGKFELFQNYPNPFNPSTKIRFSIPKQSLVQLALYNLLGELVVQLVDEVLTPGNYEYDFNASEYSSGVYLYRIKAGDPLAGSGQSFVEIKKLVLMK